jgi:RNA polymerase sigma-70 factor (family 1)
MLHADEIKELQRRIGLYDDEVAYKALFLHFYKPLLKFAASFVKSGEIAEEVVSDVFISLWERRQQLENVHNLPVYLYVGVKNTALKYLLKQKKQVAITIDDLAVELASPHQDPEQQLLTAEMMSRIEAAIAGLPPRCKIIFKLIREDGLKYKEIAQILNVSVKTIDNQLAVAIAKIARVLNVQLKKTTR